MKNAKWFWIIAAVLVAFGGGGAALAFAVKPGVSGRLEPEMDSVIPTVATIWKLHGVGIPTITSIGDGKHAANSKHYQGLAIDFRLNDIPINLHSRLSTDVQSALGSKFFVLHEYHGTSSDHLHIQYNG